MCPECGAPRGADNTPSCACTERAADAHLEARTAEAAAAEDFDPLRIRPYVELTPETPASSASPEHPPSDPAAEATMPMPAVQETGWGADEAATTAIPAISTPLNNPAHRGPPAPRRGRKRGEGEEPSVSGRRPRVLLLGAAGAVVVVLAAGGLVGGVFTYDKPDRNNTAAQDVRESVPAETTSAASPTPSDSPRRRRHRHPSPPRPAARAPSPRPPRRHPPRHRPSRRPRRPRYRRPPRPPARSPRPPAATRRTPPLSCAAATRATRSSNSSCGYASWPCTSTTPTASTTTTS